MKQPLKGKRLLEWAGEFSWHNFEFSTRIELITAYEGLVNLDCEGVWKTRQTLLVQPFSSNKDKEKKLQDEREYLQHLKKMIKDFFELIYGIKEYQKFTLVVKSYSDFFCNTDGDFIKSPAFPRNLFIKVLNENHEQKFERKYPSIMIELLNALPRGNLDDFRKCPECGRYYFHWRKRKRTYCNRTCKGRAAAKKHRG